MKTNKNCAYKTYDYYIIRYPPTCTQTHDLHNLLMVSLLYLLLNRLCIKVFSTKRIAIKKKKLPHVPTIIALSLSTSPYIVIQLLW